MHVNIGLPSILQFVCLLTVVGFLWRSISARLADTSVGKAMSFIY